MRVKTIVLGGGIAGMSCAMRLLEAGQEFLLITESLGGRIKYSPEAGVNYGAYFVMQGYTQAGKLLSKGAWINPLDSRFHNSGTERFGALSLHTLSRLPGLIRFYRALRKFSRHYEIYKRRCLGMPQKAALAADAYMADLFSKPASEFIREQRFEQAAEDYISKFTYACTGAGPQRITALDFLNVSLGMITPIHGLVFDPDAISRTLGPRLVLETITRVERGDHGARLTAKSGKIYQAENLVLAAPAAVTREWLGLKDIREASRIHVFHVRADLKPPYRRVGMNLFPPASKWMLTVRQHDGSCLVYAREADADLDELCERYEILARVDWEKAMYISGPAYMEQEAGKGLFVAGDHNGLGLEPSAISGIYAANRIIGQDAEAGPTKGKG